MLHVTDIRIRDPFVFVEDGAYYLIGTTGNDCWGTGSNLALYTSPDLDSFEFLGVMAEEGAMDGYTQIWAPELHKYKGKYYIIVSVYSEEKERGSIILVSDTLRGKFRMLTGEYITPADWMCLDASLFVWKGKPYLYFSNEWVKPITRDGDGALFVAELSDDLTRLVSYPKKIVSGKYCGFSTEIENKGRYGYVAEGPFAVAGKKGIELYWSTFTEKGYCVAKSCAEDIFGEYKLEKLIFENDGGHAMVFDDLNGKRKITLHQPNRSPDERMKVFDLN